MILQISKKIDESVYTCCYDWISNVDVLGTCYMDSICVGAMFRWSYTKIGDLNILAAFKRYMHLLCILNFQVIHHQILAFIESESLPSSTFQILILKCRVLWKYTYWKEKKTYRRGVPAGLQMIKKNQELVSSSTLTKRR